MIIFDYATLADDSHRRHFIDPRLHNNLIYLPPGISSSMKPWGWYSKDDVLWQPDYASYYREAKDDKPIEATLSIHGRFWIGERPLHTIIWCDLEKKYREQVYEWLLDNWYIGLFENEKESFKGTIRMRPDGDTTPWHELKYKWVKEMSVKGDTIYGINTIFDMTFESEGSSMTKIWKKHGVPVFEVHI